MHEHHPTTDYPIVLQLSGRLVVIVGAGPVGKRKMDGALKAGAQVRIIDPVFSEASNYSHVEYIQRSYQSGDLIGADLVFICTGNPDTNQTVANEATQRSIWHCRSDHPHTSNFTLPAILRRGNLTVAISTGGGSPAMAALLRDEISEQVPDSWGKAVEVIAAIRRKWLTEPTQFQYNQEVLRNLLDRELISLIAHKQMQKIDLLLLTQFGPGFSLAELQIQITEGAP